MFPNKGYKTVVVIRGNSQPDFHAVMAKVDEARFASSVWHGNTVLLVDSFCVDFFVQFQKDVSTDV